VPYRNSTIFEVFNIKAATTTRFSYNTTGLSPVFKNPHPTMKGQDKTKSGTKQQQPWIVRGSKNNNKQLYTKNNKQQSVSSVGPHLSL
jgi:hypothetical protein